MLHIIVAGKGDVRLEELLRSFDRAHDPDEREAIAAEVFGLVGPQITSMVGKAARGRSLTPEEVESLAWRALYKGLDGSGISRLKRTGGIDENLVARLRNGDDPRARAIWSRLSSALRQQLDARYLKSTIADLLTNELNQLLRDPGLFSPEAIGALALTPEARDLAGQSAEQLGIADRTRLNALLFASAFRLPAPERPKSNLLGFISKAVLPKLSAEMTSMATGQRPDKYLVELSGDLQADIEAVRTIQSQGAIPNDWAQMSEAERIYEHRRQRLTREFGPAREWYERAVRDLQPKNAFPVKDKPSLAQARQLLRENGIPESSWPRLPTSALEPIGVKAIQRLLDSQRGRRVVPFDDVPQPAHELGTEQQSQQAVMRLLEQGRQSRAYEYLLGRILHPDSAEYAVGQFVARNPRPTPQQVMEFTATLPEAVRDDIDAVGWDSVLRTVDKQVVDAAQNPALQRELMMAFNMQPEAVTAAVMGIRKRVLSRRVMIQDWRTLAAATK